MCPKYKKEKMNMKNLIKRIYKKTDASVYLGITESQLDNFTDLGWVKFWNLENGETTYLEDELDKFEHFYLQPLAKVVKV